MKLLVTGGCGFVGSNLAASGQDRGHDVTVFDNLSRHGSTENLAWLRDRGPLHFVHGDIRNKDDVDRLIAEVEPDVIFHLSGQVAMTTSIAAPYADFQTNALGALHVLEAVRRFVPETPVLFSSTNKVYGDLEWVRYEETETRYIAPDYPNGFDESTPLDFHSPYGCSKGSADQYMLDYARMFGLKTVVFRHSSMYGGRQFATFDQGWVGWFSMKALEQASDPSAKPFTIAGNGKQVRDVLHADDVVSLCWAAVEHMDQAAGQVFNIGGGMDNSLSLLELFVLLEELTGAHLRYEQLPPRPSDQKVFVADTSKAEKVLGWRPAVSSHEGVSQLLDWLRNSDLG